MLYSLFIPRDNHEETDLSAAPELSSLSSMLYSAWLTSDRSDRPRRHAGLILRLDRRRRGFGRRRGDGSSSRHEVALCGRVAPSIRAQRESQRPAPRPRNERKIRAALSEALEIPRKYTF